MRALVTQVMICIACSGIFSTAQAQSNHEPRYQRVEQNTHRIHLLEVDPQYYQIVSVKAQQKGIMQRSLVSALVKEYGAYAGINAGFFHAGTWEGIPAGALKIKGQWFSLPTLPRAALGWSDQGKVLVDRILTEASVEIGNKKQSVHRFNVPSTQAKSILFTPAFYQTPALKPGMTELIFDQQKLKAVKTQGENLIPTNGWAYRFLGEDKAPLSLNTSGKFQVKVLPQLDQSPQSIKQWQAFDTIVGGAPVLIKNNKVVKDDRPEKTIQSFLEERHARTAVCIKKNGHWLFMVAEHLPEMDLSFAHPVKGLTIPELKQFLKQQQCQEAINLDGGGSSVLILKNKMMNAIQVGEEGHLVDIAYERPVSDALLILPRKDPPLRNGTL